MNHGNTRYISGNRETAQVGMDWNGEIVSSRERSTDVLYHQHSWSLSAAQNFSAILCFVNISQVSKCKLLSLPVLCDRCRLAPCQLKDKASCTVELTLIVDHRYNISWHGTGGHWYNMTGAPVCCRLVRAWW